MAAEDLDQGGRGEPSRGERDAAGDVDGDPDAPRIEVVEVRHGPDAVQEAGQPEGEADRGDDDEDHGPGREESFAHGLRPDVTHGTLLSSFRLLVLPRSCLSAPGAG